MEEILRSSGILSFDPLAEIPEKMKKRSIWILTNFKIELTFVYINPKKNEEYKNYGS
jgi:hypothetical protein